MIQTPVAPRTKGRPSDSALEPCHRLLTMNIGGPSIARAEGIVDYLLSRDLDVIVLTETRANQGTRNLVQALCAQGYEASWPVPPMAGERGAAVLCRSSAGGATVYGPGQFGHRLVVKTISASTSLKCIGAYVPSRDASAAKIDRKRRFLKIFEDLLSRPENRRQTIVMGDLNVVGRSHLPKYRTFQSWEYDLLDAISHMGFVDVFTTLYPSAQAHSWIGRKGAGYRYDYAFVSPDLAPTAIDCRYLDDVRTLRLSDHSAVLLRLS